jgi:hypothetical protein
VARGGRTEARGRAQGRRERPPGMEGPSGRGRPRPKPKGRQLRHGRGVGGRGGQDELQSGVACGGVVRVQCLMGHAGRARALAGERHH